MLGKLNPVEAGHLHVTDDQLRTPVLIEDPDGILSI